MKTFICFNSTRSAWILSKGSLNPQLLIIWKRMPEITTGSENYILKTYANEDGCNIFLKHIYFDFCSPIYIERTYRLPLYLTRLGKAGIPRWELGENALAEGEYPLQNLLWLIVLKQD